MKVKEAWETLGLSPGTDLGVAKKKYRELTKLYHPDVNKDPSATDKFKKINEAYQIITSGKDTEPQGGFRRSSPMPEEMDISHISLHTTITFKEAVLGTKQSIKYNRKLKCNKCNGRGHYPKDNGCKKCGGRGMITSQRGNMIFSQTCPNCMGRVEIEFCSICDEQGSISSETTVVVTIPAGILDESILRLGGKGNFAANIFGMDQYTDVFLKVNVTPVEGLTIQGSSVVSETSISLLEALKGCTKEVDTILGKSVITIPPKSKNKEEVRIPKAGVNGVGDQVVTLNINYPDDVSVLIDALSQKEV